MKQLSKFSVDRAITVFMAVIVVIVFGVVSLTRLTTDLFPNMNIPYSVVMTVYPGASPSEVEDAVTNPLEETLATTTNLKDMQSMSQENFSIIIMEFNSDTNMDSATLEMRESLDLIMSGMPDMVNDPMIIKLNPDMMPIMQVSVTKEGFTQQELTTYVEESVLPQLERVPGVASTSVSGAFESEIQVILDDDAIDLVNTQLEAMFVGFGITDTDDMMLLDKEMISMILMAQNFEFPVGYANVEGVNYLVRIGDEFGSIEDVRDLLIFNFPGIEGVADPIQLSVDDIADVNYVNANDQEYSKVNGENAISISVQKSSDFATTDVTNELENIMTLLENSDEDLEFTILLNQGDYINQATGAVTDNLLYGAILAIIVLFIFLRSARATLIVGLSIPISLLFAIVLIYFSGITLNIVSLGGLALGIGMLVDNSIVVIENIFRLKNEGHSNREAAIEGTKQVAGAITASTITTISVFVPVLFIEGFIKEIFMEMALTIAFSLTASLLIALTLVPAISSKILKQKTEQETTKKTESTWKKAYEKVFRAAFRFKYFILAGVLILFGGSIALALTNGFEYFPSSDEGQLTVSISNPTYAPLDFDEFTTLLDDMSDDFLAYEDVDTVGISLGSMEGMMFGISGTNNATANVVLIEDRTLTTEDIQAEFEDLLTEDYASIEFEISGTQAQTDMLTGSGLQVEIRGYDLNVLKVKAIELTTIISAVEGVESVDNGIGVPADEIKITVNKDDAMSFGLTTAQVLQVVADLLAGEDVTTEVNVDGDVYDLYVYDENSNFENAEYTIEGLENLIVGSNFLNPLEVVLLKDIATVQQVEGFSSINHSNGVRAITVSANFEEGFNASFVARDINTAMNDFRVPSGYEYEIQGENEEIMEALNTLILAVALGILLIYMVMASQFQSLTYPFIIMFTIPLAFTGGFLILYFAGMPVSVVSAIGFIILVGVVVNNGIVLVDYTNQLREKGMDVVDALLEAGKTRLRPIVMTALTTILALSTMALGFGQGAEMMQPMAVTTVGGLLYATVLTLLVVPIMYYLLTKYTKGISVGFGLLVVAAGTVAAYIYLGYWYLIVIGAVLFLGLIALLFVPKRSDAVV